MLCESSIVCTRSPSPSRPRSRPNKAVAAAPAEAGLAYAGFARIAVERRATCRQAISDAETDIASHREKVQACYRELRTLELAQDNRRERAKPKPPAAKAYARRDRPSPARAKRCDFRHSSHTGTS